MRRTAAVLLLLGAGLAVGQFYDHVVITTAELAPCYAPLCSVVETNLGLYDTLVLVEDIYGSMPGRDNPEKIRSFIRHAYDEWVTSFVLLGGDVEVVPCRYCRVDRGGGYVDDIPCDLYYAALEGDWDADGDNVFGEPEDSVDLYPDIWLGRFTASSPEFNDVLVDKFVQYTGNPEADYLDQVFLNGFDLYPWCLAEQAMEFYDTTLVPEAMKPCQKVYDSHSGNHRTETLARLNAGPHIWVHSDHSGWSAMGVGWENHREVLERTDLSGLVNGNRLGIMMTNGCSAGAYDSADCIIEHYVMAPEGGGVAAFANSRTGLLSRSDPLHGQSFMQLEGLLAAWFGHPSSARLSDLATVQAAVAPLVDTSARYRWSHYQFTLFGDPVMPVWVAGQSGSREESGSVRGEPGPRLPTVMRSPQLALMNVRVLDAAGRDVTNRRGLLLPGVYFVRAADADGREAGRKVLIAR